MRYLWYDISIVRKAVPCSLLSWSCYRKNVSCTWNTSLQRDKAYAGPSSQLGISFPVLGLMCTSLFCLRLCVMWQVANSTTISIPSSERIVSFACSTEGWVETISLHQTGCRARPPGHREPMSTTEADLVLPIFYVNKAFFYPMFVWVMAFLVTSTPANHTVGWHPGTCCSWSQA